MPEAATVPSADTRIEEDPASSHRDRRAGDYTTYPHPVYGFALAYPRQFDLFTTHTMDLDETVVRHPRLPLGSNGYVRPMDGSEAREPRLAFVTSLPAGCDAEPPEGADGGAALMALDDPSPGQYTRSCWFASQDHVYALQLHAPDIAWLELRARPSRYSAFTLPAR
jgi:hypothetical protein